MGKQRSAPQAAVRLRRGGPPAAVAVASLVVAAPAGAELIEVDTLDDVVAGDGQTSLREAIDQANADTDLDTIFFASSLSGDVDLTGELVVEEPLSIKGPGRERLALDAQGNGRVLRSESGASLSVSGVTIKRGLRTPDLTTYLPVGGAIRAVDSLTLRRVTVEDSMAEYGGAIRVTGRLTISDSLFEDNTAQVRGGAIYATGPMTVTGSSFIGNEAWSTGGAVLTHKGGAVENSTFSDNTAGSRGGAIYIANVEGPALVVGSSTLTENAVTTGGTSTGGAIDAPRGYLELHNSIVSGNSADNGPEIAGYAVSEYSLIGSTSGVVVADDGGTVYGPPGVDPLTANNGSNPIHPLASTSMAIDAGDPASYAASDQRDLPRPQGGAPDIGAYERLAGSEIDVVATSDLLQGDQELGLREALVIANQAPGEQRLDASTLTGTVSLGGGQLTVNDAVEIDGPNNLPGSSGATELVIDGGGRSRLLYINGAETEIAGVTLTGGKTTGDFQFGGGIRAEFAELDLVNVVLRDNSTEGQGGWGGGLFANGSTIRVERSTIHSNSTGGGSSLGGGVMAFNGSDVTVFNSTVSGNSTTDAAAHGGGIYSQGSALSIVDSTIAGNGSGGEGGGIGIANGSAYLEGALIADNTAPASPDVDSQNGGDFHLDHSLLESVSGATIATAGSDSITGVDPQLEPLADNGGSTPTQRPASESPAVNAGPERVASETTRDQRFKRRPQGAGSDIGAVELNAGRQMTITGGPEGRTSEAAPSFEFRFFQHGFAAASPPDYECSVDGAAWQSCSSPFTTPPLADGPHYFEVREVGSEGVPGEAARRDFEVDTTGPTVEVTAAPEGQIEGPTATIEFSSPDADAEAFACAVDEGAPQACSSPYETPDLAPGAHEVRIGASDDLGNAGAVEVVEFEVAPADGGDGDGGDGGQGDGDGGQGDGGDQDGQGGQGGGGQGGGQGEGGQGGGGQGGEGGQGGGGDAGGGDNRGGEEPGGEQPGDDGPGGGDPLPQLDTEVLAPVVRAKGKQAQRRRPAVLVVAGAGEPVRGVVKGRVKPRRAKAGSAVAAPSARAFKLKRVVARSEAGEVRKYRLRLKKRRDERRAGRLLARGGKLDAKLKVKLVDELGNSIKQRLRVRLVGKRKRKNR